MKTKQYPIVEERIYSGDHWDDEQYFSPYVRFRKYKPKNFIGYIVAFIKYMYWCISLINKKSKYH